MSVNVTLYSGINILSTMKEGSISLDVFTSTKLRIPPVFSGTEIRNV